MTKPDPTRIDAGQFYRRDPLTGRMQPSDPGSPDVWICRRLDDFPPHRLPTASQLTACTQCGSVVAFNPARTVDAPKVCMQCAGIQPLPFPD